MHAENCFITLTYNDEHLPGDGSLNKKHFQDFAKRLRKSTGKKIRYFHCGEYGENLSRPHYHACIFGHDFQDKQLFKTVNGFPLFTSDSLTALWPFGFTTIGALTFETAAYTARYVMKKINGEQAFEHYSRINPYTGEITHVQPEYVTMSLKPGIGADWYEKFKGDVYPDNFVVINGKRSKPPRYYSNKLEQENPQQKIDIKQQQKKFAALHAADNTPERLDLREYILEKKTKKLLRNYEQGITES